MDSAVTWVRKSGTTSHAFLSQLLRPNATKVSALESPRSALSNEYRVGGVLEGSLEVSQATLQEVEKSGQF